MDLEYLLQKINSGSNEFSEEECYYISENTELKKALSYAIASKKTVISKELFDFLDENLLSDFESLDVPKSIKSNLYLNLCIYVIDNGYYSSEFDDAFKEYNLDQDCYVKLQEYIAKSLSDKNNSFKDIRPNFQTINELLDYKRYDIISSIDPYFSKECIDEKNYNRIIKEWPYDNKPKIIIRYEKENSIIPYSIDDSFSDLIYCYHNDNKNKKAILDVILEKTKNVSATDSLSELICLNDIYNILVENNIDVIEYAKILYDKNCLFFADKLVYNGVLSRDDLNKKIEYCLNNNIYIPSHLVDFNEEFMRSDTFINYLLDNGEIELLLRNSNLLKKYGVDLKQYSQKIVDLINNDNIEDSEYVHYLREIDYNLTDFPEIFEAIVNKGRLGRIVTNNLPKSDETIDYIIKALHKNKDIYFFNNLEYDSFTDKLIKRLFDENMYKVITYHFISQIFINDNTDYIIDKLDNNYFANLLVDKCFYSIKSNEKIIFKLVDNPALVDKVVELLINDENVISIYMGPLFDKIVDYASRKYNLNMTHVERLRKQFGINIIRYIANENMIKIINLDEETFNKVLGIFPTSQFTMIDLEASYESIIQYLYGKKNPSDITIFPTFLHAIENKYAEKIKEIKEKLIIYLNPNIIKEISQKYDLENIHSIDELLDLIISKYNTEEKNKYLSIFHELTNEFINISRENYHNNHYFEEVKNEYYNFFERVLENIDNGNIENVMVIAETLDKKFYKKFGVNKNITSELEIPRNLLNYVIFKIRDEKTRNKYLPVLKEIVDYYYLTKKSEYSNLISLGVELNLPYTLEEKYKQNEVIKHIIINSMYYEDKSGNLIIDIIRNKIGIDSNIINDCINYYSGKKECKTDIEVIKEYLPIVIKEMTNYIRNNDIYYHSQVVNKDILSSKLDSEHKIKRKYYINSDNDIYKILVNLNIDLLKNGLFTNEEMYNKLVEIMSKKKIHLLPDNLMNLLQECNISFDSGTVASFINFFVPIYEAEKKRLESLGKDSKQALSTLIPILINGEVYNGVSDVYSQILGEKDSKLIRANPGPNSATEKVENNERLKEAIKLTLDCYKRQEVTIPTFDTNVSVSDNANKKLNVIVGNFTDPSNLTHGERTGACMRIGGVGETLFDFCLHNKNGFHIRFEDPETHEYISRVSGFRNGNTVFLNELRNSCNVNKYSNIEVVNACKEVAKLLIELSKDSTCPIENVVITNTYAMSSSEEDVEINLGIVNNKEGLPDFYSDIDRIGIVLATSSKDREFVPINFDKTNVPVYKPCRGKPQIITDMKESISKISRVASIKTLLESNSESSYEELEQMVFNDGIICSVVTDDWYIYVDNNKEIYYDYINIDERAKVELKQYLEIMDELISRVVEKKEMESDVYGL